MLEATRSAYRDGHEDRAKVFDAVFNLMYLKSLAAARRTAGLGKTVFTSCWGPERRFVSVERGLYQLGFSQKYLITSKSALLHLVPLVRSFCLRPMRDIFDVV